MKNTPIHILIVAGSLRFEGQGRANQDLIRSLHLLPYIKVSVVVSQSEKELPLPFDIDIYRVPDMYTTHSIKQIIQYIRTLKKISKLVDVVHFATDFPNFLLGALFLKKPYVITAHGTYALLGLTQGIKKKYVPFFLRMCKPRILQRIFMRAKYVHMVSLYTEQRVKEVLPQCKTIVIPNAVSMDSFSTTHRSSGEYKDKQFILSVGQVKPRKGTHIAIDAFARITAEFPEIEYIIVGDVSLNKYVGELQAQIKEHSLENKVHILGRVSDDNLKNLFSSCLLYIQPSITVGNIFEGYGIVFLEAGVYHKAVIGTSGSGIEDAIVHEKTGILVPQNDVEATAEALRTLLKDGDLREEMGEANYKKAKSQDWSIIIQQFVALYQKMLNENIIKS